MPGRRRKIRGTYPGGRKEVGAVRRVDFAQQTNCFQSPAASVSWALPRVRSPSLQSRAQPYGDAACGSAPARSSARRRAHTQLGRRARRAPGPGWGQERAPRACGATTRFPARARLETCGAASAPGARSELGGFLSRPSSLSQGSCQGRGGERGAGSGVRRSRTCSLAPPQPAQPPPSPLPLEGRARRPGPVPQTAGRWQQSRAAAEGPAEPARAGAGVGAASDAALGRVGVRGARGASTHTHTPRRPTRLLGPEASGRRVTPRPGVTGPGSPRPAREPEVRPARESGLLVPPHRFSRAELGPHDGVQPPGQGRRLPDSSGLPSRRLRCLPPLPRRVLVHGPAGRRAPSSAFRQVRARPAALLRPAPAPHQPRTSR